MSKEMNRRCFLSSAVAASSGIAGGLSRFEDKNLMVQPEKYAHPETEKRGLRGAGGLPMGRIGNVALSRLIRGGNLIGGVAHSRDLIYVSKLVSNYFTDDKILDTWEIAEESGIVRRK